MHSAILISTYLASLACFVQANPLPMPLRSLLDARNNDRHDSSVSAKPIFWTAPENSTLCWTVTDGKPCKDQTIGVAACDDSPAQQFVYTTGATRIQVTDTNFCVEFGPGLGVNGRPLRLQECRKKGAPGQQLFITGDHHIALERGPGQCADVKDALGPIQSWRCIADNTNQIFSFEKPQPPPPPPVPELAPGQLRLASDRTLNLCLQANQLEDGILELAECVDGGTPLQTFTFNGIPGPSTMFLNPSGTSYYVNIPPSAGSPIIIDGSSFVLVGENEQGFFSFQSDAGSTCITPDGAGSGYLVRSQFCDSNNPLQFFEYGGIPPIPVK